MNALLQNTFKKECWTDSQQEFYQKFIESTKPQKPYTRRRLWRNKVYMSLDYYSKDCMELEGLDAIKECKGHGSDALDWLLSIADKHEIAIMLFAMPYSKNPSNPLRHVDALDKWYRKRHFIPNTPVNIDEQALIRHPK